MYTQLNLDDLNIVEVVCNTNCLQHTDQPYDDFYKPSPNIVSWGNNETANSWQTYTVISSIFTNSNNFWIP